MKKIILIVIVIILIGLICGFILNNNQEKNKLDVNSNEINSGDNFNSGDETFSGEDNIKNDENGKSETEYALIYNDSILALNFEITNFPKEPISTTEGKGDGFVWNDLVYDDIQIRVLKNSYDGTNPIMEMTTSSDNYKTPRGIKVSDNVETLKKAYPEFLEKDDDGNYTFNPDDIGFYKIMFNIDNDVITEISVFNGIDG